jgi:Holliday junction resolvase
LPSNAGVDIRRRGFAHERELAVRLYREGFAVIRAPASGSRVVRLYYPDITAIYRGRILAIEVKSMSYLRDVYIEERKIRRMNDFASRSGGKPYLAVKVIGTGEWRVIPLDVGERTPSGYYRYPKNLIETSKTIEELVNEVKSSQ